MSRFVDVYLDRCVPGYPCISSPRWSTAIAQVDSGAERANQRWQHPLYRFTLPEAVREHRVYEALRDHWLVMRGPLHTFPFRDPLDFASAPLVHPNQVPTITGMDQQIGIGDGARLEFQLQKTYARGAQAYTRPIYHPLVATVVLTVNGLAPSAYRRPGTGGPSEPPAEFLTFTVDRLTGIVTTSFPPSPGHIVRAGFLYDVEVRFETDESFDGVLRDYNASGFADLQLIEVRPCA